MKIVIKRFKIDSLYSILLKVRLFTNSKNLLQYITPSVIVICHKSGFKYFYSSFNSVISVTFG